MGIDWYVKELDKRPYKWGTHVLPHDAEAKELGTGKSRIEVMKSLGLHRTRVVPRQAVDDGINAVRMLLPNMWFDKQKCQHGIYALQNYRRAWDERRKVFHERPLHDFASHGSDAMRYWAMSNIKNATGAKKLVYPPMGIV